jgi:DNA recombination protein RmuC
MFVVRTVAHLWRTEAQNRNAQEIARRGAELYDRLAAFVADLDRVGERLQQAQESWSTARSKLASNRGNVIRQAEMLRELGVKPTKQLPAALIEQALEAGHDRPVPITMTEPGIGPESGTKVPRQALSGIVGSA